MDFRILGPLEALDRGERVALGGSKRRAVLALLLLHANETVSSERLIDELWGEGPPATAAKTLQAHVSRLRKALAGGADGPIVTHGHGYELRVGPDDVDSHRFERLLGEARAELAEGRPAGASRVLESALALWRGPPLADLAYEPFAQAEIARLEDLRVAAQELLVEASLALGRHADVIGELERLVDAHPYRERLRAQLMLALYRADRQADALQAYQDARTALVEELGIEPGERLRELERAILAQDPALAQPALVDAVETPAAEPPAAAASAEHEPASDAPSGLPSGVVTFMLTDIEGSSALWEADFDGMAAALELHDGLIARTAGAHGGWLLKAKGEGDSTMTVFPRASDAVAAAAELHRLLADADWPTGSGPRVRIAVYTGEAHERDGDYFGPALNRAARLRSLAHAGAALLSQATAEIVRERLPPGTELVELGRRELRGLARPEHVFELRERAEPSGSAPDATRKTVTVLFACVLDLEPEGEGLDAEARRRVSARCLADMRAVLERHGGAVEAYPGDTLVAVYGVPRVHEDDALRAARAAIELREAVDRLGEELSRALGLRPCVRVGVGTGDVIAEAEEAGALAATGEAVSTAKRLEEEAATNEILLDEATHGRVRGFVEAVPASAVAFRLTGLRPGGERPRGLGSPLVGRTQQLEGLESAFAAAVADRACHLVTVLGTAGVGKSRLADEFAAGLGGAATVARGRCLPYGEGITFWPLAEVVRDLPEPVAAQIADDPKAETVEQVVSEAVGTGGPKGATNEKIFWASRRLLEAAARRRPLVVILDDLQWAEPTFLDLVEHLADLARDAPMVLLCMARPELLDSRPAWGGGKLHAASIHLDALGHEDTRELVANLLSQGTLPEEAADRLAKACEGNPLYAEELLSMLIDDGRLRREGDAWALGGDGGRMPVPPTIQALLAARLEQLPDDERALLARLAVAGSSFHGDTARELAPASLGEVVDRCLIGLVRRDLIRPDRAALHDEDAYRFRHILIRDAAYESLPKETRAELHERFAGWIERTAGERLTETEEILGYHLEQAHRYVAEVGPPGADARGLAARAAERLTSAGRRALARGDTGAAVGLLERAAALTAGDEARRAALLPELGAALIEAGRLERAEEVLGDARAAADAAADERSAAHTGVQRQFLRILRGESADSAETETVVDEALPVFARVEDEQGMSAALRLRAWGHWLAGRAEAATAAWEDAVEHASRADAEHERIETLLWIASAMFFGPAPASEGIRRCEAIRTEVEGNLPAVADVLQPLAGLHAMQGRFAAARELLAASEAAFEDLGLTLSSAVSHQAAMVELLAGDPVAAERKLRRGYDALQEMGDRSFLSTTAALLGQAVLAQGRAAEADELAATSAELGGAADLSNQILWRPLRARVLAGRGELASAEELAREAVVLAERTDFSNQRADALAALGGVLAKRGRMDDAQDALAGALDLFDRKGNTVAAERLRAELALLASL